MLLLRPSEVLSDQLVEPLVVPAEVPPELRDDEGVDSRVAPTLALPQTPVRGLVAEAVEALRLVEVEVVRAYSRFQSQKLLYSLQQNRQNSICRTLKSGDKARPAMIESKV